MKRIFTLIAIGLMSNFLISCIKDNQCKFQGDKELLIAESPALVAFPNTKKEAIQFSNGFNVEITPDSQYIWQGDIILTPEQVEIMSGPQTRGGIINAANKKWPYGDIPYRFHSSVTPEIQQYIHEAMNEWCRHANITFTWDTRNTYKDFIIFKCDNNGNRSQLGKVGGAQDLFLDNTTVSKNKPMHEIGHAIGMIHEQCRSDRDDYIIIKTANIKSEYRNQFSKESNGHNKNSTYDFNSIMGYGSIVQDFAINRNQPVMTKIDGSLWGNRMDKITDQDMRVVATIYGTPQFAIYPKYCALSGKITGNYPITTSSGSSRDGEPVVHYGPAAFGYLDDEVTLRAVPESNRWVEGWYLNGEKISTTNTCTIMLTDPNAWLAVKFGGSGKFKIRATDNLRELESNESSGGGNGSTRPGGSSSGSSRPDVGETFISGSGDYIPGQKVTLTVPYNVNGRKFVEWREVINHGSYNNGMNYKIIRKDDIDPWVSDQVTYSFIVDNDRELKAIYK